MNDLWVYFRPRRFDPSDEVESIARHFGGVRLGGGWDFGTGVRDVSFSFRSDASRARAKIAIKKRFGSHVGFSLPRPKKKKARRRK